MVEQKLPYLFDASEANQAVMEFATKQAANKHLSLGWPSSFPSLKEAPSLFPGQIWVVQACTGEGKSALSSWWSNLVQTTAMYNNTETNKSACLNVVLEESIEHNRVRTMGIPLDFIKIATGEADLNEVRRAIEMSVDDPMFYIGPSMTGASIHPDAANFRGLSPHQLGVISYTLKEELKVNLLGCVIDYMQIMSDNDYTQNDMAMKVRNASNQLRDIIHYTMKCPTLVCAQSAAGRVKERAYKVPTTHDIEWNNAISQDVDTVWSLWKPSKDMPLYKTFGVKGKQLPVLKDVVFCKIDKWRHCAMEGETFAFHFGKPFGDLQEIDNDKASRLDLAAIQTAGFERYADIPDKYFN